MISTSKRLIIAIAIIALCLVLDHVTKWIAIQNYQEADWNDLVQLWKYTHLHFAFVIRRIPPEKLDNEWIAGENEKMTLEEMIEDFPRHFKLHLNEINHLLQSENQ